MQDFIDRYFRQAGDVLASLDKSVIADMIDRLDDLRRRGGRLFILGVGGSAANASHAVNDFRKIAGIEAYAPTDNVAELTARINDDGWDTSLTESLKVSRLGQGDMILIFSVGGGSENTSGNLVQAVDQAKLIGAQVLGVVSRDGGHTLRHADACLLIPPQAEDTVTPLAEAFQAIVWHLFVTALAQKGAE